MSRPERSSITGRTCHCDRSPDRRHDRRAAVDGPARRPGSTSGGSTLAYTKSDEHSWAPGTVWLDWDTMFRTCLEIGRAVAAMGAGTLVFANGHGGNTALLRSCCGRSASGTASGPSRCRR